MTEALRAGGFAHRARVDIRWVPSDECADRAGAAAALEGVDGVLIPGGFGVRGIEGKIGAVRYARENGIPTLGLCLGLQCMVIEAVRHVAGVAGANSAEFDPDCTDPVIATMADQDDIVAGERDMGGTMRLGAYPAKLRPGSVVADAYGGTEVSERHRHRYEVNNAYRQAITDAGLVLSGTSPDGRLVEFVELDRGTYTRSSSLPRRIRSSSRGRPGRTRCSGRSWPPRWYRRRPSGYRWSCRPTRSWRWPRGARTGRSGYRPATAPTQRPHRTLRWAPQRAADMPGDNDRPGEDDRPGKHDPGGTNVPAGRNDPAGPRADGYQVLGRTERFGNRMMRLVSDEVRMPDGGTAMRDYLVHVGAVGVVAIDQTADGTDRVLLVRQYRHPVGAPLWELPAGLTDEAGEPEVTAAQRELAEEADLSAGRWDLLVDVHTQSGLLERADPAVSWPGTSPRYPRTRGTPVPPRKPTWWPCGSAWTRRSG